MILGGLLFVLGLGLLLVLSEQPWRELPPRDWDRAAWLERQQHARREG